LHCQRKTLFRQENEVIIASSNSEKNCEKPLIGFL